MTSITTTKIPSRRRRATATGRVPVEDAEPIAMRGPTLALDIGPGDVHTDATAKGVWLMIARPGEYHKAPVGDFALTKETTFPEILHNWERDGRKPVPVDYEHQGERADLTGPTPACGWITDIKVDAGNLMAFVQWLPEPAPRPRRGRRR